MAGSNFGGPMIFTLSSGAKLKTRGTIKVSPSNISKKGEANDDGSVYSTVTNKPYGADINFQDDGFDYRALMLEEFNATLTEDITGVQHLWTNAQLEGDPVVDRRTGEVSGLKIFAPIYQRI